MSNIRTGLTYQQRGSRLWLYWDHPWRFYDELIGRYVRIREPQKYMVRRGGKQVWPYSEVVYYGENNVLPLTNWYPGTEWYSIRTISGDGSFAGSPTWLQVTCSLPDNTKVTDASGWTAGKRSQFSDGWLGTKSGVQVNGDGYLELVVGETDGVYTSPEYDLEERDKEWMLFFKTDADFEGSVDLEGPDFDDMDWDPDSDERGHQTEDEFIPDAESLFAFEHDGTDNIYDVSASWKLEVRVASTPGGGSWQKAISGQKYVGRYVTLRLTLNRTDISTDSIWIEELEIAGANLRLEADYVEFNTEYSNGVAEGRLQWNTEDGTLEVGLPGGEVNLQIGQEQVIRCRNESGGDIPNGSVVYQTGASGNRPLIDLADASDPAKFRVLGVATEAIAHNTNGYVTLRGLVRDVVTTGMTAADILWLSATTPGGFTTTRPTQPLFGVAIGAVLVVGAGNGVIGVRPTNIPRATSLSDVYSPSQADKDVLLWNSSTQRFEMSDAVGITTPLLNGAAVQSPAITVTENAGTVYLNVERSGTGDIDFVFDSTTYSLDCTPILQIALTAGTDIAPQINYIYVVEAAGVLSLATSLSGWPATSHAPIATVLVQSAAHVATHGAYKVHAWTDHISKASENGHLSHINRWIRNRPASWLDGIAPSALVVSSPDAYFTIDSGNVYQLHEHTFPALDVSVDGVYLINDPTTAYKHIHTFDDITQDAAGGSINVRWFPLIVWGVVSEASGDCKLFINLPAGTYSTESAAEADAQGYGNYTIPAGFRGTGFLIANYIVRGQNSGAWSEGSNSPIDLRGKFAPTAAGGGGAGVTDHLALTNIGVNAHTVIDTHLANLAKHRIINDGGTGATDLWSASHINLEISAQVLNDHSDVDAGTPSDDDVLTWIDASGKWEPRAGGGGAGDVVGPASVVDSRLAAFDTTTGKLLKDSGKLVSDFEVSGAVATHAALTVAHGATGAVAGTTNTQTFTNKKFDDGIIINESGADSDTRIEADAEPYMIFVDASTNRVGIGEPTPSHRLTVTSDGASRDVLRLIGPDGTYKFGARLNFGDGQYCYLEEHFDDHLMVYADQSLRIEANNDHVILISNSGGIGIQTASPSFDLDVNGTFRAVGNSQFNANLDLTSAQTIARVDTGTSYSGAAAGEFWFRDDGAGTVFLCFEDSGGTTRTVQLA